MKNKIGEIKEIWRYPVKSMAGHTVTNAEVQTLGIKGDRGWALKDRIFDEIVGAKRFNKLLQLQAEYVESINNSSDIPAVKISLPDGRQVLSDDSAVDAIISAFIGQPVTLNHLQKDTGYYRKLSPPPSPAVMRHEFGMTPDGDLSGIASMPLRRMVTLGKYATLPFTHYDAYPLHFLTSATLQWLQETNPEADIDVRRFRPNFLIDTCTTNTGFLENQWCGGYLEIGASVIKVESPTIRCSMPAQAQPGLKQDNKVASAIRQTAKQFVGSYASVVTEGEVCIGDPVNYLPASRFRKKTAGLQRKIREKLLGKALSYEDKRHKKNLQQSADISAEDKLLKQGFMPFVVRKKIAETHDVTSFYISPQATEGSKAEIYPYLAGQHIVLAMRAGEQYSTFIRSYSLSQESTDNVSENGYRISVKKQKPQTNINDITDDMASGYLHDHIKEGDTVFVKGPHGQFYLPPANQSLNSNAKPLVFISIGVGITPMFAMLEQAARENSGRALFFIHGTQNKQSHLFSEATNQYSQRDNITLYTAYSQANGDDHFNHDYQHQGRLELNHIKGLVGTANSEFYLCGTYSFMQTLYDGLIAWGVDKKDIHYETFKKAPPLEISPDKGTVYQVHFKRSNIKIPWTPLSGSLLELAEEQGIYPEAGCRYGACQACSVKVINGEVIQDDNCATLDEPGSILLCSARPGSDIEIDL
ncbi:MAG: MOSC domain-containing protein [Pseudomonadales bacterium]|nr:MOSC domain-containing protein [Pseudomonadales bacterium]